MSDVVNVSKKKILLLIGTRPEVIKMVPVYRALKACPQFSVTLVSTGQHREMLTQALSDFEVTPDADLHVMLQGQSLASLSARLFTALEALFEEHRPDCVLVQGDTTTVQVASLCAFYRGIRIGHVEAGLRSFDIHSPFPEELNRKVTGLVADWHFAPTEMSRDNLLREGVPETNILVSGNPVIDSLYWMLRHFEDGKAPELPEPVEQAIGEHRRILLVTAHRRENQGEGLKNICAALREIAGAYPDVRIVYPVHLNPAVRSTVMPALGGHPSIILTDPLSYKPFVRLMNACHLILTDSGGIQEEGPSIGKPVLVMRHETERPEGVQAGVNFLVGVKRDQIVSRTREFLDNDALYQRIASIRSPYGDGKSGEHIAKFLCERLH